MDSENQPHRKRRKHSPEFKAEVIAACSVAGASIKSVALSRGLNPSLVGRWLFLASPGTGAVLNAARPTQLPLARTTAGFVAVAIENPQTSAMAAIRLELRRGAASVTVDWPLQEASVCGAWLREWLR